MGLKLNSRLRPGLSHRVNIDLFTILEIVLTPYVVSILLNSLNEVFGSITNLHDYDYVKILQLRDQNYT